MSDPSTQLQNARLCLAIEASNPGVRAEIGVGFVRAGESPRVLAIEPLREVGRNEDDLLPSIDRACRAAGIGARQIQLVCVSIGPGGYTSLRVACAAAKMICETTGAACVPAPTALALVVAQWERASHDRIGVRLAGKDQSAHLTRFERGGWKSGDVVPAGTLVSASEFPLGDVDAVIGDRHVPAPIRNLLEVRGIAILPPVFTAAALLELAAHLPAVDPLELLPLYPREPDAVTLWRNRAQADRNK